MANAGRAVESEDRRESLTPDDIKGLIEELGDPRPKISGAAAQSLFEAGAKTVKPLVKALAHRTEKARWEAIKLLEKLRIDWTPYAERKTIEALIDDLDSSNGFERIRVRSALVQLGSRSVPYLVDSLSSKSDLKRWEAAKVLTQIGDPTATQKLINALYDKNFDIRWLAAEGLISVGEPGLIPVMHELVNNPESEWLREGAHHYLHEINNEKLKSILNPVLHALEDVEAHLEVPLAAQNALESLGKQRDKR
jgi:HEAT repeat protein